MPGSCRLIQYCMTTIDDQHYINLVIKGDTNAFAVLANQYKNMVFSLALKMVKNREEAEEVAQDAFIKVYKSLGNFKGDSKFSTWLYTITYNTCLDRLRKYKREQHTVTVDEYIENQLALADNTLNSLEDNERKKIIQDCLLLLPGEDSFLLTLFYFEEQSVKEIAGIIGVNANHVKIKLYRSRKRLAAVLKTQLDNEMIENYESEQR